VNRADFEKRVAVIADRAFEDQCTPANPKLPLVSELEDILRKAFEGVEEK
jgi:acetaldehyde dehydrogenase/alcohol dehydrogenase